ncbi:MAG: VanW family protein [Armatimonadota bacterium]|nr:VanW family protein [Armatimonadota bacterium]
MTVRTRNPVALLAAGVLVATVGLTLVLVAGLAWTSPAEVELAGYATSLRERSTSQRHNARLAARALNGTIVAPGATFSFNRTVRSWTVDRGYVKAPVSYDGELVRAFGGGVCQTSTTLYNAALLAGLSIIERHPHVFAPAYVSPGRDAAVAQYDIDLRFGNPYPWPVRLQARVHGERLEVHVYGRERPAATFEVATELLGAAAPARLTVTAGETARLNGRVVLRSPGATGYRVATYRLVSERGTVVRRELLSEDAYQAANRIVMLRQAQAP